MKILKKTLQLFLATIVFTLIFAASAYYALTAYAASSLFGGASLGVGHVIVVSDAATPNSGISFDDANGKVLSSLSNLQVDFNVTNDNCGAGSPRFRISIDTNNDSISDGDALVNLGPSPNFDSCTQNTWIPSGNLIGNNDSGRWDFTGLGGVIGGYDDAPANVLSGRITDISVVVDGGANATASGGDGEQTVLIDNVSIVLSASFDFEPATLVVDDNLVECPTAAYTTIQSAVNDATTGSIVQVCAGTYPENVILNKDITLNGAQSGVDARGRVDDESIIAPISGIGIELDTGVAGATIDGFTFAGGGRGIESDTGPLDGLVIANNRFLPAAAQIGVFLNDPGTDITLDKNSFQGSGTSGTLMHLDTDSFNGFWFTGNDVMSSAGTGFFVDGNHNVSSSTARAPKITGNLVQGNQTGANLGTRAFNFGEISGNTFKNNTFDGLQGGIQDSTISNNTFEGNGRSGLALTSFGNLGVDRGGQRTAVTLNTFTGNGFTQNGQGVSLSAAQAVGTIATNSVNRNSIAGNFRGFRYTGGEIINAECNWWGAVSGPSGDGPGSGDSVASSTVDFTAWLTTSDLVSGPCDGPLPPPPDVTVTIVKYVDGNHATAASASSLSFPMDASWDATNIGAGSGSFALSTVGFNNPNEYEATTADMTNGADYSVSENLTGPNVGASCSESKPFAFAGYSVGDTEALAAAAATTSSAVLTDITSDKFIIVWNETCAPAPTTATITLLKTVVNDDSGSESDTAWTLSASGPTPISGVEGTANVTSATIDPGTYNLSESGPSGYTASAWVCSGTTQDDSDTITVAAGETITCTITNDDNDVPPPPPSGTACDTPTVAPSGYTLLTGTANRDVVTLNPFTMFVGNGGNDDIKAPTDGGYIVCVGNDYERITIGNGDFIIAGGDGYKNILIGNGNGTIKLGNGPNRIVAGSGNHTMELGDGNNNVTTGGGESNITAGNGFNRINAGGGNDTITTGDSNDNVDGGAGTDTCDAGLGFNTVKNCEL